MKLKIRNKELEFKKLVCLVLYYGFAQYLPKSNTYGNLGGVIRYVSQAYEKKWIYDTIFRSSDIKLAICLKENDLHIGNIYLTGINYINRTAESHILIGDKDYWGKGYAREALLQLLKYGFNEHGLNRIEAHINADNPASLSMHTKCGYKKEGVLRKALYKNGRFKDVVVMSILKEELLE